VSAKCKYCYSKLAEGSSICSICKIDSVKTAKDLTGEEKKVYYQCRTLYTMGFLAMIGGLFSSVILLFAVVAMGLAVLTHQASPSKVGNAAFFAVFTVASLGLSVIWFIFGFALRRYRRWCYGAGIAVYLLAFILNVLAKNFLWAFFSLIFIYYIASPLTKKILYREL